MKKLKEVIDKIQQLLNVENIRIAYFKQFHFKNEVLFEKPEIAIEIDDCNKPKWDYFTSKLNYNKKIVSTSYFNNLYIFHFNECTNEEILYENLKIFYISLQKRYFLVSPKIKQFSVLIMPTHRCNLDCKYCYDKPYREKIKEDMSIETLDRFLSLVSEYSEKVNIVWHGGEPTLVGIKWFKEVYENIFPKYPMTKFEFSIMTNGVLLNDDWAEFFKKYNIQLGVSYNVNYQKELRCNSQNIYNSERDNNLENKLKSYKPSVLEVINKKNYKSQIEIYEYYKKIDCNLSMNHVFRSYQAQKNKLEVDVKKYSKEYLKYFKYWLYDKGKIYERSAIEMFNSVISGEGITCKYSDCRYRWLSINPIGELYPCNRYYPDKYKIGNIKDFDNIESAFNSNSYQLYVKEVQKKYDARCSKCGYFSACKSGCNASSVEKTGGVEDIDEFECELFKLKFNGVYQFLRNIDVYEDEKLNPYVRKFMLQKGFYSVKEIKESLKELNNRTKIKYDPKNLIKCSEYKIFRGINYSKDFKSMAELSMNFTESTYMDDIAQIKEKRKKDLRNYLIQAAINSMKNI